MTTAAFAVLSLYLSLYGTINAVPLQVAVNTLIARPTPDNSLVSTPLTADPKKTAADLMTRKALDQLEAGQYDYKEIFVEGFLIASETGSFELLDAFEKKDGSHFTEEFRRQFDALRKGAQILYYGRSGYGPYFWFMHTTMFPVLVISTALFVYAASFLIRLLAAAWVKRVSRSEKPYNYIAVCSALCGTACGIAAYLCK